MSSDCFSFVSSLIPSVAQYLTSDHASESMSRSFALMSHTSLQAHKIYTYLQQYSWSDAMEEGQHRFTLVFIKRREAHGWAGRGHVAVAGSRFIKLCITIIRKGH